MTVVKVGTQSLAFSRFARFPRHRRFDQFLYSRRLLIMTGIKVSSSLDITPHLVLLVKTCPIPSL